MDLSDFYFLHSDEGAGLLAELTMTSITPQSHLQLAARLRKRLAPERVHALLETALLRQRAVAQGKFTRAAEMFFTRPGLEQSSSEPVSTYRAGRFAAAGVTWVADLGCGVGGDALALAAHSHVAGLDRNLLRLAMARANGGVYGHAGRFHPVQADLLEMTPLPVDAVFFDPGRRDERGNRLHSVHEYRPPLRLLDRWRERVPHAAAKISPGVDYAELPPDAEIEFISLDGGVKECVLWFGDLRSGVERRATLLPAGDTLTTADETGERVPVTRPGRFLYEPDGAVIRAHLVEALAQRLGARKIDDTIAYLTADDRHDTPFARCFAIEETMPFHLKDLRHRLRARRTGRVTIKKRGSPLDVEELRRRLRLDSDDPNHDILFLTHVQGEPAVLLGREQKE